MDSYLKNRDYPFESHSIQIIGSASKSFLTIHIIDIISYFKSIRVLDFQEGTRLLAFRSFYN